MTDAATETRSGYRIGYARCSTDKQDLRAQKSELGKLSSDRVFTDEGFTGTKRDSRAGLDQALAALRDGDTLVVTKLDRLARSVPDARAIADEIQGKGAAIQLGAIIYDPHDPMGKMFFNILATFAEFEADLVRMRTREGMAEARRAGKLRGKQPSFTHRQDAEVRRMHDSGDYTIREIAGIFTTSRPTIYRSLDRTRPAVPEALPAEQQHQAKAESASTPEQTTATAAADTDTDRDATAESTAEVRAIGARERIDADTVSLQRSPATGATRVLGTTQRGKTVLVGLLERQGHQWHAYSPRQTRIPGHWRTRQEALLRLIEPRAAS